MPFFILFVLIPLAEIMVFVIISQHIGLGIALLFALLTAITGGFLVKYQGFATLFSAQESLAQGRIPSQELFDGLCIVAAGALLITPGFISDFIGFALLFPPARRALLLMLLQSEKFTIDGFNAEFTEFHDAKAHHMPNAPDIIEAEYEVIEKQEKRPPRDA